MDVDKETGIKRYGKYFCSEDHAQDFLEKRKEKEERNEHGGGCC